MLGALSIPHRTMLIESKVWERVAEWADEAGREAEAARRAAEAALGGGCQADTAAGQSGQVDKKLENVFL